MAPHVPSPSSVLSLPVHTPGLTRLTFSPDGQSVFPRAHSGWPIYKHTTDLEAILFIRFIFTGGADTAVRVFKTAHGADEEPQVLDGHNEDITFLDCSVRLPLLSFAFLKGQTNSS